MPFFAVGLGGCLGACARYGIALLLNGATFPWATLAVNLVGSFFLTWFYTVTLERWSVPPNVRLGIGTGFVGAFTTFSTYTVDGWKLLQEGHGWEALVYVGGSLVAGLAAAWIGYRLAIRQTALKTSRQ